MGETSAPALINEAPKGEEEFGSPMNLVQDHEPPFVAGEKAPRFREPRDIQWIREIQIDGVGFVGDPARKGGLAALARAQERYRRLTLESAADGLLSSSRNH